MNVSEFWKSLVNENKTQTKLRNFYYWVRKCPYDIDKEPEKAKEWLTEYALIRNASPNYRERVERRKEERQNAMNDIYKTCRVIGGIKYALGKDIISISLKHNAFSRVTLYKRAKAFNVADFSSFNLISLADTRKIILGGRSHEQ